ncbi:hypothetical protein [Legionella cardiaca]|uniref:Uncharacterized protein n=1 Tax=Legionella cardiaca TaxID=1071983 RepID=A0ABY8AUE0_9GAMM|nr:hypothetical protein [Legionella cardiaca]WED44312.1 hypothetical protein PXX05_05865 [Legionella cardiaca]
MTTFFEKIKNALSMQAPYNSSSSHRNAQRGNAMAEVVGEGLEMFNPVAVVPSRVAQVLISGYQFFRLDIQGCERAAHLLQAAISATHMGLVITLFFQSGECDAALAGDLCKAIFLCNLLYKGTLLVGWAPSEMYQEPASRAAENLQV